MNTIHSTPTETTVIIGTYVMSQAEHQAMIEWRAGPNDVVPSSWTVEDGPNDNFILRDPHGCVRTVVGRKYARQG